MSKKTSIKSYFSVDFEMVPVNVSLTFDLYVNSSGRAQKDRFVRIFPIEGVLTTGEIHQFKGKYHQLYVLESQRDAYLRSFVHFDGATDVQKTEVIKDSAIQYLGNIFDESKEFTTEVLEETIAGCRESVESMVEVIQDYDVTQVQNLIGTLSFHDFYTYDHSVNVSMYCISLFRAIKPDAKKEEVVMAGLGGLLHDLGKIKIPTTIINNSGNLSDEEFEEIKKHPKFGYDLVEESDCHECCKNIDMTIVQRVIHEHHENYNGSGYPQKIDGNNIHLYARITAVADFFDAITTKRSYHEALTVEDAIALMEKSVGKKLDPILFKAFKGHISGKVMEGKSGVQLPDDFDPCQPHNKLPFQKVDAEVKEKDFLKKEKKAFGKVQNNLGFGQKKEP